ncbi:hypothetical protein HY502_00060, partial [Candidatus Woesebacteria bacterium]|nr:hypothetical protein [Candidatus Woesebacteria bacterium]
MLEMFFEDLERRDKSLEDKAIFALARVQGAWNQRSKKLLVGAMREDAGFEGQGSSRIEKVLVGLAVNAAAILFGEGSIAETLLGHSIILPEEDRGIITLMTIVGEGRIKDSSDWKRLALFSANIAAGENLENTLGKFKTRIEKFNPLGEVIKKIDPDAPESNNPERKKSKALEYFAEISGGSDEKVQKNKGELQEKILVSLENQFGILSKEKLLSFFGELN